MSVTEGDQSTIETPGAQGSYLESLYELYLQDHTSVPDDWRFYFDSLPVINSLMIKGFNNCSTSIQAISPAKA